MTTTTIIITHIYFTLIVEEPPIKQYSNVMHIGYQAALHDQVIWNLDRTVPIANL